MTTLSTAESTAGAAAVRRTADTRRFWRVTLAAVAPLAGIAIALFFLIEPYTFGDDYAAAVQGIAAHQGAAQAAIWCGWLFSLTVVPSTVAVVWVCRRATPRLTTVAAVVSLGGYLAAALAPSQDLAIMAGVRRHADGATLASYTHELTHQPVADVSTALMLLAFLVGTILLGVALLRARVCPRWTAVVLIVSGPLHLVSGPNAISAVAWALTAVGSAGASFALLRMRDDEFDLPPTGRP